MAGPFTVLLRVEFGNLAKARPNPKGRLAPATHSCMCIALYPNSIHRLSADKNRDLQQCHPKPSDLANPISGIQKSHKPPKQTNQTNPPPRHRRRKPGMSHMRLARVHPCPGPVPASRPTHTLACSAIYKPRGVARRGRRAGQGKPPRTRESGTRKKKKGRGACGMAFRLRVILPGYATPLRNGLGRRGLPDGVVGRREGPSGPEMRRVHFS